MGYVVLVPLAAVVFYSLGRHPLAGLAAAFAGVSGGYSANLFIGTVDPLLSGITTEAARLIDPTYEVDVSANWFFMIAFVSKYEPKAGVGTLIAMMLLYSVAFIMFWSIFFYLWTFVLGLPVGPASPTYYTPG